ncbi:MAG: SMP-30/gluconolactonase/LRE family protein [Myxococcales bacterium]|nr:SMP-30/gluconolactonase/LRE family protein [Myxococcales bacterium]
MTTSTWKRRALWGLGSLVVVVAGLLLVVRLTLGSGEPYPDVSTAPRLPAERLEVLVELPLPPGNVTSSRGGRIFFDTHPFTQPQRFAESFVFELVDGQPRAYPSEELQPRLQGVLGMTVDAQDRLWMIAPAGLEDRPTRLFAFDLATDALVLEHDLDEAAGMFCQDLRVSPDGKTVYLADTGAFFLASPALVVFDVESRTARRVLEGHPSIEPQDWAIETLDGPYTLAYGLVNFSVGVDGLAVSHDGRWLYYATMSHDGLYRVPTAVLRDPSQSAEAVAAAVERVGGKPLSDGIEIDAEGRVYVTDVEHGGVAVVEPDGTLETLVRSEAIVWADAVNLTADGSLLVVDSEIPAYIDPLLRPPAEERLHRAAPHRIYRVRL